MVFPFIIRGRTVLKGKACPPFGFDETSDAFIVPVEQVMGFLPGETNRFLGSISRRIAEGSPTVLY